MYPLITSCLTSVSQISVQEGGIKHSTLAEPVSPTPRKYYVFLQQGPLAMKYFIVS